ncbi:unnamed protein product [Meloidogyne enterolobii]|uniref:Uncharacterized protein n=1 Tax=Meloidogyne enterolobii TaxID=390850 RepID=A0ACB0ZMN2_MELEN
MFGFFISFWFVWVKLRRGGGLKLREREREGIFKYKKGGWGSLFWSFLKRGIERERFNEKIEKGSFQFLKVKF